MAFWSFEVTMKGLTPEDREFLVCDLAYFKADLHRSFKKEIEKMSGDRSWRMKIMGLSQKLSSLFGKPVTDFNSAFENLRGIDLRNYVKYEIIADGNGFRMSIDDMLFEIWGTMANMIAFGHDIGKYIFTKKSILRRFEQEIRKAYTTDFEINEIKV